MDRFILFPKEEVKLFNEGKKYYKENNYKKAIPLFQKATNLKYLKTDCIKFLIDCHIELHNYEEVYKMIEDEFVDKNVEEEYLLKKYLYTMVLDEQYIEASEIIKIYKENKVVSQNLKKYLEDLLIIINKKLYDKNNNDDELIIKCLKSDKFEDHIQIILNLEKINFNYQKVEIEAFLNNKAIDSFVKYNLLKYLFDNEIVDEIYYTNYYDEKFLINTNNFFNILESENYINTINLVIKNIENDYAFSIPFIKNIWLDYCVKHYPNLLDDINLSSCILNAIVYKSINIDFNINDLCKLYNVSSKRLFQYFDC